MCGIAGIVSLESKVIKSELFDLGSTIYHRGPDAQGIFMDENVGLVSTRLSILDVSLNSNMPMSNETNEYIIVYNGEIYNFKEIREELISLGYFFKTSGDTEVVLNAYMHFGKDCFKKFNGMWGLCIWDKKKKELIISRDFFGKKNVYYYFKDKEFIFASEVKSIWKIRSHKLNISFKAIYEYMAFDHMENTLFNEVSSLPPGSTLIYNLKENTFKVERFFQLTDLIDGDYHNRLKKAKTKEIDQEFNILFNKAIEYRLISDVPTAVMCSGGVDSGLITLFAKEQNRDINAYIVDVKSNDNSYSERTYAEELCNAFNIKLNTVELDKTSYLDELIDNIYYNDFPPAHLGSSIGVFLLCKQASSDGIKVILSGEAADEIFGGYTTRYRHYYITEKFQKGVNLIIKLVPKKIRKFLVHRNMQEDAFFKGIDIKDFSLLAANADIKIEEFKKIKDKLNQIGYKGAKYNAMMILDLNNWISSILLRNDRASMQASVETRVPFLDINLIKFAVNLPLKFKINLLNDKIILKRALARKFKRSYAFRKKNAFSVPFHIKDINYQKLLGKGSFVRGFFNEASIAKSYSNPYYLSKIILLELWHKMYIEKVDKEELIKEYININ